MEEDDIKRLSSIFESLDTDGNGRIDVQELTEALQKRGEKNGLAVAKRLLLSRDYDESGAISLSEFLDYAQHHEKRLKLVFSKLDKNQDGVLDFQEVIGAFQDIGIILGVEEAKDMLRRIGDDGSVEITWEEWRDYLLLSPSSELNDVVKYWRHATYMDVGEDTAVPDDFTTLELNTGISTLDWMWWRHLVAGGVAGSVSRTFTAPLDRIKVFLQVGCVHNDRGLVTCLRGMLSEGGWTSLWRGNGVNVVKIAPESALKFMAYEQLKRLLKGDSGKELKIYERFVAGSLAGAFSQSVIYPLEVVKTRLALRKTGEYSGVLDITKKMLKSEGPRVFYRGYIPNLLGILPYAGIDLAVYETLKNIYSYNDQPSVLLLLTCGTVSSACGQLASYPLALVRTRLQANTDQTKKLTMGSLFQTIIREEGLPGLYRGLLPNFLKVAPAVSISYVVYERVRLFLGVQMS